MIQRQQSLWLLLATICSILSFRFPFYGGASQNATATSGMMSTLYAGSTLFLILITAGSIFVSLVTIFMFKNRKLQLRLTIAGLLLSLGAIALYFLELKKLDGVIALSSVFVFMVPICYFMAARGIWKDEKLVKSLDKLR